MDSPFVGGVNNVRIWSTVRTPAQIAQSMRTPEYGTGQAGLELECTLDSHWTGYPNQGLTTQLWVGDSSSDIGACADIPTWTLQYTRTNANIFIPDDAPPNDFGLIFSGYLLIDDPSTALSVTSDDGSIVWLDGTKLIDNDGPHNSQQAFSNGNIEAGLHTLRVEYFQNFGGEHLEVRYATGGGSWTEIPADHFYTDDRIALYTSSTEGKSIRFEFKNFQDPFPDSVSREVQLTTLFPGFEFRDVTGVGVEAVHLADASGKELLYHVSDWTRVTWDWEKQFQLTVKVAAADPGALAEVSSLPFLSGDVEVDGATSVSAQQDSELSYTAFKQWVPEHAVVTVGTRYRTDGRCWQLSAVTGQLNAFGAINMKTLVDGAFDGAVTRQYGFPDGITAPGTLVFNFVPTIFRAEIPIGEGLDVSSTAAANAQLVPDLCGAGPALLIDQNGPTVVSAPQPTVAGGLSGGQGPPYIWDFVGEKFFPLQPGIYRLSWTDANDSTRTYAIEINAQFPTEQVTIQNRENEDGSRQGSAPDYLTDVTYSSTAAAYPATPGAHYHYVVSPNRAEPTPTALDENPSDRWAFQRLGFSERTTATVAAGSPIFTETTPDVRSVLVFSYQPDSNGVASGDLTREAVAVRVVKSLAESESETSATGTVGTRLTSALDQAGFGSGYILYDLSNYNPQIHNRLAGVGLWGPIYPVNWSGLYTADDRRLRVAYYQNPYLSDPASTLHPDVAWPYIVANYDTVNFPGANGNMIYIASRLGSEGVNAAGDDQVAFDPAKYANVVIYNQPDRDQPGYNPNEEHALIAPSIKDQLTGDTSFNLGQNAAFALQNDINVYGATDSNPSSTSNDASDFTSEPCVLVQFDDLVTGEKGMMAYRVEKTRPGDTLFPALDPTTHQPTDSNGTPVPQPTNPKYDFIYPGFAGDPVIQPYPLNLVVGNVIMSEDHGGNIQGGNQVDQRTLWFDKNDHAWMVSGGGEFFYQFWYPFREDFWYDSNGDHVSDLNIGRAIAWVPKNGAFIQAGTATAPVPRQIVFDTYWRTDYPVLKRGETMTYAGGEYQAENPLAQGLPGIVGWASAQLIYDSRTPDMVFTNLASLDNYSARVIRPLDQHEVDYAQSAMPDELTPANTKNVMVVEERWYFKALTGSLQKRFYYDSLRHKLVFRGRLNDHEGSAPNLTAQPVGLYVLEPNFMSPWRFCGGRGAGDEFHLDSGSGRHLSPGPKSCGDRSERRQSRG